MAFPARHPGRCADCGWPFDEGDLITMTDDGAMHANCDDTTVAEAEAVAAEFPPADCDSDDDCLDGIARISDEVRYVTEWEELPRAQDRLSAESEASQ